MSDLPPPPSAPPPPPPPPPGSGGPPPPPPPPPGYHGYHVSPYQAYMKPVAGLAKALRIVMICLTVVIVLTLVVTIGVRGTLIDYLDENASRTDAEGAIGAIALIGGVAGLLQIAVVVLTMIWMYRLAANAKVLGRTDATWGPGWAIAGWFLPPFLFVIPFLMFRELWKGSDPAVPPHDPSWKRAAVAPLVTVWWVFYGLGGLLVAVRQFASAGFGGGNLSDAAEFYRDGVAITAVATAIQVAAAVTYVMLVARLTARQQSLIGG